jgi:CRISPR/Cas system-associated exonuclease Cas4 (RecB family)
MARKRNLFDPHSDAPFRLSRSKIDLYMKCRRCFYLDRRLGVSQPGSPPFSLNSAVDELLKKEFDEYRHTQKAHPLVTAAGVNAVPFQHSHLEVWRESLRAGISYALPNTTLVITGGIDDVWLNHNGQLHVVDYKATSKNGAVSLDADWQIAYKRQVEIYQWLFRKNGFDVSNTAYFVYCNGDKSLPRFDKTLSFSISILPYEGSTAWIEPALSELYECLRSPVVPKAIEGCDHCEYRLSASRVEQW